MKEEINHILIPKHVRLSDKQKQEVLNRYNVTEIQMPKIRSNDAALAGLDAKKGDMIKVIRKTKTAGTSDFFRVVV